LTDQHPHAELAARAAEAAAAQGDQMFWSMHDRLYEHRGTLTRDQLEQYAAELDLDLEQFRRELDGETHRERIREDHRSGRESGVDGVPTFFINGERYDGPLEFESLLEAVARAGELTDVNRSLTSGNREIRETLDLSHHGAPAAGRALRDRFSADEIFQRVTASAHEEIDRGVHLLFFSGLAAGLIIGASFFGRAVFTAAYPGDPTLVGNLFYPVGFIAIVLGGYQLFTENTLTPVTLVFTRVASIPSLLRIWGIVLVANVAGAGIGAAFFAWTDILEPSVAEAARGFGEHALSYSWGALFFKATVAGGLVATMVWLVHAARDTITRFFLVYAIMFLIPAGELFHCVVGAFEVLYLVFIGAAGLLAAFWDFFVPVVLGNTVGGVVLVASINYAMTEERKVPALEVSSKMSPLEWLFGRRAASMLRD
jgi:formate/nitrite transporter FocA (FNT family)